MTGYDVAIVGSGIVGLGAAYAAHRRGLSAIVIERSSRPTGASVRNFGHVCATPQSGLARAYATAARELWLRLAADAGFWLRRNGTFVAARHQDELDVLAELAAARDGSAPGARPEVELHTAAEFARRVPVLPDTVVGGALLPYDLQVDPREAVEAIAGYLEAAGVAFLRRTTVLGVDPGSVSTSRGRLTAASVVVAANHDIDLLYPELAERAGVLRCGLDMLRVDARLSRPLDAPLLTGWSLARYSAFAELPSAERVRSRLHAERPDLAVLDLNQMYTQLPDGSVIVGDTHYRDTAVPPFQPERAFELLLEEFTALFGAAPVVRERWQGVYASAPEPFLDVEVEPGVHVASVTTGIGMTTGLGFADDVIAGIVEAESQNARESITEGRP